MDANYYLEQLYQDMRLRAYSEHTQDVYGRAVRCFLNFSGKSVEALNEQDVRNYVLHLMGGSLSKGSINTYQAAIRFFFGVSAPVIKCKKTPRKKCSFVAEEAKKR